MIWEKLIPDPGVKKAPDPRSGSATLHIQYFDAYVQANPAPVLDSPDHLPIFEDQLLDGLQNWMDRLFEGSTYRYRP